MMLVLYNMRMIPSNVRKKKKKKKRTTKCDKNIVTCDVGTTQCEDGTLKCEKQIRESPNVTKVQSHVMLVLHNERMIPSNVRNKIKESPNVIKV